MILLVRDEDVPTVAGAVAARAAEGGLVPAPRPELGDDPFALLGILTGPRAMVAQAPDQVVVTWLPSLDLGEAAEWGAALSRACAAEVVTVEARDRGARVEVYDEGELDEAFDVPLGKGGTTRAPALAVLATTEEGEAALEEGLAARTPEELVQALVAALGGAEASAEDAELCVFEAPEEEVAPALVVAPAVGGLLEGAVGGPVASMLGQHVLGVSLVGAEALVGVRLELRGDALALIALDEVEVLLRTPGGTEREQRTLPVAREGDGCVVTLPDALLEAVPEGLPDFDPTDMFATIQRIQASAEARVQNTLTVLPRGRALRAGEGRLVLAASPLGGDVAGGEGVVPVRVRAR